MILWETPTEEDDMKVKPAEKPLRDNAYLVPALYRGIKHKSKQVPKVRRHAHFF